MDLLSGYQSSGSSEEETQEVPKKGVVIVPAPVARRVALMAAPKPSLMALTVRRPTTGPVTHKKTSGGAGQIMLMNNPKKSVLMEPSQGPASLDPHGVKPLSRGDVAVMESNVFVDELSFQQERTAFQRAGIARAPDAHGTLIERGTYGHSERHAPKNMRGHKKRKTSEPDEPLVYGSDDEVEYGIWGPPTKEERERQSDQITDLAKGVELDPLQVAERAHVAEIRRRKSGKDESASEAQDFDRMVERKMSHLLPPRFGDEEPVAMEPSTKFHGDVERDYRGRSWIEPPPGVRGVEWGDVQDHACFVPKKCIHRFTGHNKGVHRIRLFPGTGHLLLSAGLDGKCKVWSVGGSDPTQRRVMRTYMGHSAAVRDVQFNHNGTKFLSCSFDRFVRLWNTETGEVLGTYTNRRVPYVVQFYPHDNNTFVVGCSDNKVVAYDATTGEITQEYNHHLAPVNTITFVEDNGTKMVTSSDDKKVLVWEWDIGVPIKYISDPSMHSMPAMTLHPSGQFLAGQSLDNQICVYQGRDRFALQRKKKYLGHQVAGYACDLCFSPDGQFLVSGDSNGKLYFWNWRNHRLLQTYRAHDDGPSIGCVWHPVDPSIVFSCGWDGVIKMWQ